MKYIDDCLTFIFKEKKQAKKETMRLINLSEKDHLEEGQSVVKAKVVGFNKNEYILEFPPQFTKIREEKRVEIYQDKQKVAEAEVCSIDYLNHQLTINIPLEEGPSYLIILSQEVSPFAIINSLKSLKENDNQLVQNLINRENDIEHFGEYSVEKVIKTVSKMKNNNFLILEGAPGAGKTYCASKMIEFLLKNKKSVLVSSNSHSAINNLCKSISFNEEPAIKICSRHNQMTSNEKIKNEFVSGQEIDDQVEGNQFIAGTCFALSKIKDLRFDFLIIDEASQLKMSFLLSVARLAKKVVLLGDPNQLQSISIIPMESGGESILDYLMQGQKIVDPAMGYFLNTTYRMEPKIAKIISDVFYEGQMKWIQKKNLEGISLITSNHNHGQKISKEEAEDVLKIYSQLIKNGVAPEEIMVVSPYNAQIALIKSLIKNPKAQIGTCDLFQGREADYLIYSCVSSGNKKENSEFATNPNRVNVALSRAKKGAFLVAGKGLQDSKFASNEFKKIVRFLRKT